MSHSANTATRTDKISTCADFLIGFVFLLSLFPSQFFFFCFSRSSLAADVDIVMVVFVVVTVLFSFSIVSHLYYSLKKYYETTLFWLSLSYSLFYSYVRAHVSARCRSYSEFDKSILAENTTTPKICVIPNSTKRNIAEKLRSNCNDTWNHCRKSDEYESVKRKIIHKNNKRKQ